MMRQMLNKDDLFRRLVIGALRQFCTDCKINNEPIIAIDGRLLVTAQTGAIYELTVHEINMDNVSSEVLKEIRDYQQPQTSDNVNVEATVSLCCESVVEQGIEVAQHLKHEVIDTPLADDVLALDTSQSDALQLAQPTYMLVPVVSEVITQSGMCITILRGDQPFVDASQTDAMGAVESGVENGIPTSGASIVNFQNGLSGILAAANVGDLSLASHVEQSSKTMQSFIKPTKMVTAQGLRPKARRGSLTARRGPTVRLRDNVQQGIASLTRKGTKKDLKNRRLLIMNKLAMKQRQAANTSYACFVCNKSARTALGIRRHMLEEHPEVNVGDLANEAMPTQESKSKKKLVNTICHECGGLIFDSHASYQRHRKLHHYKHRCGICQIMLNGRAALREHVSLHHPGVPVYKASNRFICEFCSFVCGADWLLQDHINTTHFGAVHECDVCGKILGSALTLRIHRRQLHDANYRHTCEACGIQFSRGIALRYHLRSSHPHLLTEDQLRQMSELTCAECGASFARRSALRQHIELKHSIGRSSHPCPDCGRGFTLRRYLRNHQRTRHPLSVAT